MLNKITAVSVNSNNNMAFGTKIHVIKDYPYEFVDVTSNFAENVAKNIRQKGQIREHAETNKKGKISKILQGLKNKFIININ